MAETEALLKTPAVAAMLHVSDETVRNWVKANRIPHIVLPSGHPRFRRADIERILAGPAQPEDGAA